ncbi:MAG: AMP-dependent synthetase [Bradyrhizobium sp.]|nr:AMP-dependent synthetase [Bradyrhizobium sp.]
MHLDLIGAVREHLAGGDADALAFGGRWRSWRWLGHAAASIDRAADGARAAGLVSRNRPQHVAAFAAGIAAQRTTAMIYAAQSPAGIAADIRLLALEAVFADPEDWTDEALEAARETGTAAIAIEDRADGEVARMLLPRGSGPFRAASTEVAFELLSSGTTGAPKRVPLTWGALTSATADTQTVYAGTGVTNAPQLMVHPLGNVAGIAYLTPPLAFGQRIVLLEKLEPAPWAEAIRTYRPVRASLPPAGVRMVLDAGVAQGDIASLTVIGVGGGKLDRALHERFEAVYGIPILTAFGATEFGGVVANWTLDSYRQWGEAKRGSAGRASANVELRVVDAERHEPVVAGDTGLLEAKVARMGPGWIRTTDLASIDADGFLFLHGRADGAINRGGFKIVPAMVAAVLQTHPAVAEAAVVGIPDVRLGEVPVAAVELVPGATVAPERLRAWVRERLVAYQVPVTVKVVAALPRNASMKVSGPDVKALFE